MNSRGLSFLSSCLCQCVDIEADGDQLVASNSTVTEIGCWEKTLEFDDKESEPLFGMFTARLGFCVFVNETVGEKIVGGKGETIVL